MSNPHPPSEPGGESPGNSPGDSQYGQPYGQAPGQPAGSSDPGTPPPPPPGEYGAPGGYQQPQKTSPLAVTSLVTGIISVVLCFCWAIPIFPITALITGFFGKKQISDKPASYKGGGLATAGIVLGVIGVVIAVVYWILFAAGVFDNLVQYSLDTSTP